VRSRRILIEVIPGRIDIVSVRGRTVLRGLRVPMALEGEAVAWLRGLANASHAVAEAVRTLDAAGAHATILYRSPAQALELTSLPVRSSGSVCEAATLACLDALPYSAANAVCEARVIGRDRGGEKPQTHVLVAADRNEVLEGLVKLAESAGLRFTAATPVDAPVLAWLTRRALRHAGDRRAWLHIGEHASFFLVAENGSLIFHRRINLGVDTLARSLTLPIRSRGGSAPIELSLTAARALLHRQGLGGESEQIIDVDHGLTLGQVMPLVQPVLQRYVIELRQSLRFGLPESQRGSAAATTLSGPGAAVRGLGDLLSGELGLEVGLDPEGAGHDPATPGSRGGELAIVLAHPQGLARLGLVPFDRANALRSRQLKRWLWTGAAAAVAVIGIDGVRLHARLADASREAEGLAAQTAGLEALTRTQQTILTALSGLRDLEATIDHTVGAVPNLRAAMQEFSLLVPENIELTTISLRRDDARMSGKIAGLVQPTPGGGDGGLEKLIRDLRASPLFEDVVLEAVLAGPRAEGDAGQRFEASFIVVPAPAPGRLATVDPPSAEAAP
jgi:Tfp pilus assembly protein PilN